MWVAKFSLIHECILGTRCKKLNLEIQSIYLSHEIKKGKTYVYSFHHLLGEEENIKKLLRILKKDKRTIKVELNGHALFLLEKTNETPSEFYDPQMFLIKPVIIENNGWEHWEIASFNRELINNFIDNVEEHSIDFKLHSIKNEELQDVYFPKIMPKLTDLQKKAIKLAIKNGYYEIPKKTTLRKLAELFGVALATYQRHLQSAEKKIIPDSISHLK